MEGTKEVINCCPNSLTLTYESLNQDYNRFTLYKNDIILFQITLNERMGTYCVHEGYGFFIGSYFSGINQISLSDYGNPILPPAYRFIKSIDSHKFSLGVPQIPNNANYGTSVLFSFFVKSIHSVSGRQISFVKTKKHNFYGNPNPYYSIYVNKEFDFASIF
ncbi:hypothetical protein [Sulfurimonas sp.]|uniref:hypothetical protein n=1 Tax=Sulfurimonas sp. TaxID=2022749 RepID=UPI0025ECFB46|nr:hypothetical protein [Sulfurimonas sp.]